MAMPLPPTIGGATFNDPSQNPAYWNNTAGANTGMSNIGGGSWANASQNPLAGGVTPSDYRNGIPMNNQFSHPGGPPAVSNGLNPNSPLPQGMPAQFGGPGQQPQSQPGLPTLGSPVSPPSVNWGLINNLLGSVMGGSGGGSSSSSGGSTGLSDPSGGSSGAATSSAGGGTPTFNTNITAGPVLSPAQTAAATSAIQSGGGGNVPLSQASIPASSAQQASLNQQAADSGIGQTSAAAVDFNRAAAQANANQLLQSQQARAQQGVNLASFLTNVQSNNFQNQQWRRQLMNQLMSGVIGPMMQPVIGGALQGAMTA